MADFPPNLDDGELWLPSDILPDEVSSKVTPEFPSELTYMEELSQQLSASALVERSQTITIPPPNLTQKFQVEPVRRFGSFGPPRSGFAPGYGGGFHHVYVAGRGSFAVRPRPVYQFPLLKPAHTQVERFEPPRFMVLQTPQNQGQNRFLPLQINGSYKDGGFVKESGGTGVFFPIVKAPADVKKKQSVQAGETEQKRHRVKKFTGKKHAVGLKPPPEKGLPQDWTY